MKIEDKFPSHYMRFSRQEWAKLRLSEPMTLTEDELMTLKGINEDLSLDEVAEIYLPLSRLLNLYISSNLQRHIIVEQFLGNKTTTPPYIVGITGSVAVGKSTTARVLQALLSRWPEHRKVALITTDGFLCTNQQLQEKGIMNRKGFPDSYDTDKLIRFISQVKAGIPKIQAPVYSHLTYDIVPDQHITIDQPDILIIEGVNVLQNMIDQSTGNTKCTYFLPDFIDFAIYVDANETLLEKWYIDRFLKLRKSAFSNPASYFRHYAQLNESEATSTAKTIWHEINLKNLKKHILPTKERANLIMIKGAHHAIDCVKLRK